ncbi:hypothetical protein X777_01997 [Ooceraea biroi]|uniref:Uncharacterized protein n=1 Tax=Ooceraea biroi TaxID=2015173 RepID=A0A026WSC3_OOCBI|nr:hypothetical protein X777_01997 [Ooceraea biroi]
MLKEELKKAMGQRFFDSTGLNIKEKKCFVLATVLDPRFKTKFLSDENKAKQWIIDELLETNRVTEDYENNTQSHNVSPLPNQDIISETHNDIWKCFDDIVCRSTVDRSAFCHKCGSAEHKASICTAKPKCLVCLDAGRRTGTGCLPRKRSKERRGKRERAWPPEHPASQCSHFCPRTLPPRNIWNSPSFPPE